MAPASCSSRAWERLGRSNDATVRRCGVRPACPAARPREPAASRMGADGRLLGNGDGARNRGSGRRHPEACGAAAQRRGPDAESADRGGRIRAAAGPASGRLAGAGALLCRPERRDPADALLGRRICRGRDRRGAGGFGCAHGPVCAAPRQHSRRRRDRSGPRLSAASGRRLRGDAEPAPRGARCVPVGVADPRCLGKRLAAAPAQSADAFARRLLVREPVVARRSPRRHHRLGRRGGGRSDRRRRDLEARARLGVRHAGDGALHGPLPDRGEGRLYRSALLGSVGRLADNPRDRRVGPPMRLPRTRCAKGTARSSPRRSRGCRPGPAPVADAREP